MAKEIPATWQEMQATAQDALRIIDMVEATKIPKTLRDAVEGRYFDASTGVLEAAIGRTSGDEMREWGSRAITLARANAILREFEGAIVKSMVLSSSSPFRILFNALTAIPRWIVKHMAEIVYIFWPLFLAAAKTLWDLLLLVLKVRSVETDLKANAAWLSRLYSRTPVNLPPVEERKMRAPFGYNDQEDAQELLEAITKAEAEKVALKEKLEILSEVVDGAAGVLDAIALGIAVGLSYLAVEELIKQARALANSTATFSPIRELRDKAVEAVKAQSLPQSEGKRTWIRKASRRN